MPAKPPPNARRRRASLAAVARRMRGGPTPAAGPPLKSYDAGVHKVTGPTNYSQPQSIGGYGARAASLSARKAPPRTLGHATHQSEVFTGREGENPNSPRTAFGHAMQPGGRAGKKFKIGFTSEGRIIHLYGGDVAPGERRVVLPQSDQKLKLMDAAQRRARRRA